MSDVTYQKNLLSDVNGTVMFGLMLYLFLIMKQLEVRYNGVNHSDKGGEQI